MEKGPGRRVQPAVWVWGTQSLLVYRALELNPLWVRSKSGPCSSQALVLERLEGRQACHDGSYLPGSTVCLGRRLPYRVPSPHPPLLRIPQALQGAPFIWAPSAQDSHRLSGAESCLSLGFQCWGVADLIGTSPYFTQTLWHLVSQRSSGVRESASQASGVEGSQDPCLFPAVCHLAI